MLPLLQALLPALLLVSLQRLQVLLQVPLQVQLDPCRRHVACGAACSGLGEHGLARLWVVSELPS